jgi:hypothetical protein
MLNLIILVDLADNVAEVSVQNFDRVCLEPIKCRMIDSDDQVRLK